MLGLSDPGSGGSGARLGKVALSAAPTLDDRGKTEGDRLRTVVAEVYASAVAAGDRRLSMSAERTSIQLEAALEHRDLARGRLVVRMLTVKQAQASPPSVDEATAQGA